MPTDAVIMVTKTTICDADLRILTGEPPAITTGHILGHEGVGIVEETGSSVMNFKIGDRVLISCITSCGACKYCRNQLYAHRNNRSWLLGYLIDSTQAEYVRIPYADFSLHPIPAGTYDDHQTAFTL